MVTTVRFLLIFSFFDVNYLLNIVKMIKLRQITVKVFSWICFAGLIAAKFIQADIKIIQRRLVERYTLKTFPIKFGGFPGDTIFADPIEFFEK